MFKKIFGKKDEENINNKNVLITALLIHAAKIDDNYTDVEKKIIKKALISLNTVTSSEAEELLKKGEEIEQESNQIIAFTKEIKKEKLLKNLMQIVLLANYQN